MSKPTEAEGTVFYRPESYDPDESAAYMMRRIISVVSSRIDQALEPRGLTHAQWIPLLKLHWGVASNVAELARECQLDAGAMTRTLDRLEAKGLLTRVRSSADRRVVNLELTPEGEATASQIPGVLCKVQNDMLQPLSVAEWEQLRSLLRRVLQHAVAQPAQPSESKE